MPQSPRVSNPLKRRRTTLTLPVDLLKQAQRIARRRDVNLTTVIAEAVSEGLRVYAATKRSEEVFNGYRKALTGFSKDEMAILDGVILELPARR